MAPLAQFVVTFGARCFWVRVLVKITNGGFLLDRRPDVARRPARKLVNVPCEKRILQIYFPLCLRRASCIFFLAAAAALARSLGLSSVGGGVKVLVLVETKGDLLEGGSVHGVAAEDRVADKVRVSVVTGEGLDRLATILPELVYSGMVAATAVAPVLTRRRQATGIETAATEVEAFQAGLLGGLPPEVASAHLREAETALEEVLGVISTEDVLDALFAEFCVGK